MRVEAARRAVQDLPINPAVLATLRDTVPSISRLLCGGLIQGKRKALELFRTSKVITSRNVEGLLGISQRAARNRLAAWTEMGFVVVVDPAKKTQRYGLGSEFISVLE